MIATFLYNTLLVVVDVAILLRLRVKKSLAAAGGLVAAAAIVGLAAAKLLGEDHFAAIRLAAWGVFAHGVVLSLGIAVVFWRSRRGWSIAATVVAVGLLLIAVDAFVIEPQWLDVSHVADPIQSTFIWCWGIVPTLPWERCRPIC